MEFPEYHFIAIGGIGQSALAEILLKEGKTVSGSDISKSKYVQRLEKLGAKVYIGHSANNISGSPKVVISSAVKEDNPELKYARDKGLEVLHRSDLLKIISQRYPKFFGFCGTHGKTTTSGLCAYLLSKGGYKPAYAIGGIIPELNTNGDCEDKNTTFSKFLNNLSSDAKVLINLDNKGNLELIEKNKNFKNFVGYSIENSEAKYRAKNIKYDVLSCSFDFCSDDKVIGKIELSIPGKHNVINALGVASILYEAGIDFEKIAPHFKTFSGMGRRFQKSAEFNSIRIIDDYAHHPSEIRATLEAVKNYKDGRIVAIFQPHRFSRFKGLYEDFKSVLSLADYICVLDVYAAGESCQGGKTPSDLAVELVKQGKEAKYFEGSIENAAKAILPTLKENDIVFTLGAGDITKMGGVLNELYMLKK